MAQHGEVLKLSAPPDGKAVWAYRYRTGRGPKGRRSVGFATRAEAQRALRQEIERLPRVRR
jgi:hypothetical protein